MALTDLSNGTTRAAAPRNPWSVDWREFPSRASAAQALDLALRYAVLAPSGLNSQPWLFHQVGAATADLYLDRTRGRPMVDPDNREAVIGCAAALRFARFALEALGQRHEVRILPDPGNNDLLARLHVPGVAAQPDAAATELVDCVPRRRTNRGAFRDQPIEGASAIALLSAAAAEQARLYPVPPSERAFVEDLIWHAESEFSDDVALRDELASWLRAAATSAADGVPADIWGLPAALAPAGPEVVREAGFGDKALRDYRRNRSSPLVTILATPGNDRADWMAAGQAMARVLLTATARGLDASFLNSPLELSETRALLTRSLCLPGEPQLILRFGHAESRPEPSARRPLESVLIGKPPPADR